MEEPLEVIEYREHKIEVWADDDPANPCTDWDMASKMVCWHRRYRLGHEQPRENPEEWLDYRLSEEYEDIDTWLSSASLDMKLFLFSRHNLVIPLYLYDHGSISISTGSFIGRAHHAEWDSGVVGWIYISHENILKEWGEGGDVVTDQIMTQAIACLNAEVRTYNHYLTGEVYGFKIIMPNGEESDSCWGYYGSDDKKYMIDECKAGIDARLKDRGGVVEYYFIATDPGTDDRALHGGFWDKADAEKEYRILQRRSYQKMTEIIARREGEGYIEEKNIAE